MSDLNEKLRILLKNRGWTQARLAEQMHVHPDTVQKWIKGKNTPSLETVKEFCDIFFIPIQDLTNDDYDIPEYYEIGRYLPAPICYYPEDNQDSMHIVIDAALTNGGILHRFMNPGGSECSAIYQAGQEIWWHYREHEAKMIHDWNEVHSK